MVVTILVAVIEAYIVLIVARALLSWFPMSPGTPLARVNSYLVRITEPVLAPVRRILPPIGVGGQGIDLSVLIVVIVAQVIVGVLER